MKENEKLILKLGSAIIGPGLTIFAAGCGPARSVAREEPTGVIDSFSRGAVKVEPGSTVVVIEDEMTARAKLVPTAAVTASSAEVARKGRRVPDFTLHAKDGSVFNFADVRGKNPVILMFCCNRPSDLQLMGNLRANYESKGVKVVTVLSVEGNSNGLEKTYPVFGDPDLSVGRLFGVQAAPTLIAIGTAGDLADRREGESELIGLDLLVEKLLSDEKIAKNPTIDPAELGIPLIKPDPRLPIDMELLTVESGPQYPLNSIHFRPDDITFIHGELSQALDLSKISEQDNIAAILNHIASAGSRYSQIYCRHDADQGVSFERLREVATFAYKKFSAYSKAGIVDTATWQDYAKNFAPACAVQNFPTEN